ncbi:DMT family transporter [Pseudorhodoferax sp. Leaf265]|jgi:drug/metabolite transporter (DMT)-like permease|uniref:DMT family transporter n=1 Tax=Pseudorhodoferax sp. Leaf265 TaxID=1736315 RepID=UPI0006F2A77C|nr:DMT family transporter [Pseudorhodoferax sp. Leaf265]KQP18735.1 multidrug DMT transporter permease [Pseudorhodoferax sp. Leaf265]PZP99514.1 MAG: EamA/RhaT family transporter [Variovorax paradoxus]PZQ11428.1 MAG: EamA/RhaT family transporter [Variovorax paradoxus]
MSVPKGTWLGVACGMAAGAAWGLVFLAPELAPEFNPLQLSAARYLAYGLIAAALLLPRWPALRPQVGARAWRALFWLSLLGNSLYYVLLASAVQIGGMAMTSLVIGFLPVAVTWVGSRGADAVPLRRLAPSLVLGLAGVACIAWESLAGASAQPPAQRWLGFACAVGALVSWSSYAVGNSRQLARLQGVSAHDWSLLTGVVTGAQALALAVPAFVLADLALQPGSAWWRFVGVSAGVALLASVLGNALWNQASRLLPLTLVGQMVVFETLFALLYGFLWEARWPTALEWLAMALVTSAVLSCISAHRAPAAVDEMHP